MERFSASGTRKIVMIVSCGPFWCLLCSLVVSLPGGDTMRKDDA